MQHLLSGFRVLDLCDGAAMLCGRLFADMGADVVKVEPPGGDPSRRMGPFYHDIPHEERSLFWFGCNRGKRGVTLDIRASGGQKVFLELIRTADCVIESFEPGYMESLGLGYSTLSLSNPGIIMTSITPFGQKGCYAGYKGRDLIVQSMGGLTYLVGYPDKPPVVLTSYQGFFNAAADAAVATMIALYHRQSTGEGQWVDVSAQQSVAVDLYNVIAFYELAGVILKRQGPRRAVSATAGASERTIWRCRDGYISFAIVGAAVGARTNKAMTEWLAEEGMATDFLKGMDWDSLDLGSITQDFQDRLEEPLARFFLAHTKSELFEGARRRRIMLYPVSSCADLVHNEQLEARGFWQRIEHPELGDSITYPGAFFQSSRTPATLERCPPRPGEHNVEVYEGELGLSSEQVLLLEQGGVI